MTPVWTENQLGYWQFWAFVIACGVFGVFQVHTLNLGLMSGIGVSVICTYESACMVGQLVLCGVPERDKINMKSARCKCNIQHVISN